MIIEAILFFVMMLMVYLSAMKRIGKHHQSGIIDLVFVVIVFALIIAGVVGFLYSHQQPSTQSPGDNMGSTAPKLIPGSLGVQFKDSTQFTQAQQLVHSLGLTWPADDASGDGPFYPVLNATLDHTSADAVVERLRANPRVRKADSTYSSSTSFATDPPTVQTDPNPQLHVIFQPDVSWPEGEQIAKDAGVIKTPDYAFSPADKGFVIDVPVGHEKHYIDLLKRSGLVKDVQQNTEAVPV